VEKFFYCQNPFPAILRRKKNMSLKCLVKNFAQSIFLECTFHVLFETHIPISPVHPFWTPSGLFSVALKLFELLTYKFVTFPIYEFYTFSQIFRTIDFCLVYLWHPSFDFPSWPRSRSFRSRDYSDKSHNANITLKICTDVVYIHVYVV
jgi:hypothetical protein